MWSDCLKSEQTVRDEQKCIPIPSGDKRLSKDIPEIWVWLAALLRCWYLPCPTHITSSGTDNNDTGATLNGAICRTHGVSGMRKLFVCEE